MKSRTAFLAALLPPLLLSLPVSAQAINYRGRVLDRVGMAPVVEAEVKSGTLSAVTNAEGRFTLAGTSSGTATARLEIPVFKLQGGVLLVENLRAAKGEAVLGIELLDAGGKRVSKAVHTLPAIGPSRVNLFMGRGDFVGFARIRLGNDVRIARVMSLAGVVNTSLLGGGIETGQPSWAAMAGGGTQTGQAEMRKRSAGAAEVTVSKARLLPKTLTPAANDADLGDIVLDYPPRHLGVGAPVIYGAQVLFPASGDSASARSLFEEVWIHKMNSWRESQGLGTTPVLWKVRPDPESASSAYKPSLLPCCQQRNGSPGWGYDDIVTRKLYRDYQLHLEFNMMGPDDGNTNSSGYCNSGVYITGSLEVQIETPKDASNTNLHGLATLINKRLPDKNMYPGPGKWQTYDITWRAPRSGSPGKITVYWNSELVHNNQDWGSGSGNPVGLQLQNELGSDVRYRNIWLKELDIKDPQTNFGY